MRKTAIATFACAAFALSPAAAQQAPSRTTDDYVCTFAGQCADQAQADDDAATTKQTPGSPRMSAARGFSLARPNNSSSSAAAARKAGNRPAQQRQAAATARPRAPVAASGQRADLQLAFELGSWTMTSVARAEARVFAESLMRPELRGMKFVIEGHTDAIGGREYNIDLSRRRAQAVADYLIGLGVARDRLDIRGYGYDKPLPGLSASAQQNRRVEAVRVS